MVYKFNPLTGQLDVVNKPKEIEKGLPNGIAELDGSGKVPTSQLPSYVDDVLEFAGQASLPATGDSGKIYITTDNNKSYRWSGTAYIEIAGSVAKVVEDLTPQLGGDLDTNGNHINAGAGTKIGKLEGSNLAYGMQVSDTAGEGGLNFRSHSAGHSPMFGWRDALDSSVLMKLHTDGLNINGNIAVTGTVDGRDVAADGIKIDASIGESYETLSKNIKAYPLTINRSGSSISSVVYDLGSGQSITKTLNFTGDKLTSVVLSGDTPTGIDLTKTLTYTNGKLTNLIYS